jgi:hypothetical protein
VDPQVSPRHKQSMEKYFRLSPVLLVEMTPIFQGPEVSGRSQLFVSLQ